MVIDEIRFKNPPTRTKKIPLVNKTKSLVIYLEKVASGITATKEVKGKEKRLNTTPINNPSLSI